MCNHESDVYTETVGEFTIRIVHDDVYDMTDDYDNLSDLKNNGIAVHAFHKRYIMPHVRTLPDSNECDSWEDMRQRIEEEGLVVFALSMTDHSSRTCYLGGGRDPWDSGQIGFVVVNPKTFATAEQQRNAAESVARYYNALLQGEVYGYIVEKDGEEVESVWGFIGDMDDCLKEAMSVVR